MSRKPQPAGQVRGRHRRPRRRSVLVASSLALAAAVGFVATTSDGGDSSSSAASGCGQPRTLSVVAAPDLVPAVETVSSSLRCVRVQVTAGDPSTVARQVAAGEAPSDVWISDSSRWVTGLPVNLSRIVPRGPGDLGRQAS